MLIGTALNALDTGQFFSASAAKAWNCVASMPGTTPFTLTGC